MKTTFQMRCAALVILCFSALKIVADETTSIFLPIADQQTLVGSIIQTGNDNIKTMAIACPSGEDSNDCGFPTPITITAGPSTIRFTTAEADNGVTVDFHCDVQGGGGGGGSTAANAACTEEYTGPASLADLTLQGTDGSKTTSWTSTTTLSAADVTYLAVTITAGATASVSGAATAASGSSISSSSMRTSSGGGGATGTSSTTSRNQAALQTGFKGLGAIVVGLLALAA